MNKTILLLSLLLGASTISAQSTQCTGIAISTEVRCLNKTLNLDSERCHHHAYAKDYRHVEIEVEETGFQFTGWFHPLAIYCYFVLWLIIWAGFHMPVEDLLKKLFGFENFSPALKNSMFAYDLINGIGMTLLALVFFYSYTFGA